MSIYTHQSDNVAKTWILISLFFALVIGLGWIFTQIYDDSTILYAAIFISVVMNIVSYWYSDKIALKMAGAKLASREEYFDLYNTVENLAITAGLPMPQVYVITDIAPNAFATGRDKNNAAIAVTTSLLVMLDRTELEGVIAHELSHIGNRDILLSTVVVVLVGFVTIISDIFLRTRLAHVTRDRDNRAGGILLLIGIISAILAPLAAVLIQLAISRKREFLADASGALLTRYPQGLASALQKISSYEQPLRRASNATAHLYISNPFGPHASHGISKLFLTHPPVGDRIKALQDMG